MPDFTEQQIWYFSSELRAAYRDGKLAADQIALLESAGFQFDNQSKKPVVCIETAMMYPSMKDAAEAVGLKNATSITNCMTGNRKSAAGYHWRYATDEEVAAGRCLTESVTDLPEVHKATIPVVCMETATLHPTIKDAAKCVGLKNSASLGVCLRGKTKTAGGYHWRYATEGEIASGRCLSEPVTDLPEARKCKRPVVCMETATMYPSIKDAAKAVGLMTAASIANCVAGKQKSAAGYHWRYATDEEIAAGRCLSGPVMDLPNVKKAKRPVVCMETGVMYPSVRGAGRALGLKDNASISNCLTGKKKSAGGLHWRYATDEEIAAGRCLSEPMTDLPQVQKFKRPAICMETATMYPSINDASRAVGLKRGTLISDCMKGKKKSAGGLHWRYATDEEIAAGRCLSEPMTGLPDAKKAKRPVVCMETATMYPSGLAAAKAVGLRDISACLRGKQKTGGGYHWRYATDEEIAAGHVIPDENRG